MDKKIMECGCAPQGTTRIDGVDVDICITHMCTEPMEKQPDLTGRTARCAYFGRTKPQRRYANDECNYGCRGNPVCQCGEQPSDSNLAFFKYKPDSPQDTFYCGCHGWD